MKTVIKEFDSENIIDMITELAVSNKEIPVKFVIAILSLLLEDSKVGKDGNRLLTEQLKNYKEHDVVEFMSLVLCNSIAASLYYTVIEKPEREHEPSVEA